MEEAVKRRAAALLLKVLLCDSLEALAELVEILEAEG